MSNSGVGQRRSGTWACAGTAMEVAKAKGGEPRFEQMAIRDAPSFCRWASIQRTVGSSQSDSRDSRGEPASDRRTTRCGQLKFLFEIGNAPSALSLSNSVELDLTSMSRLKARRMAGTDILALLLTASRIGMNMLGTLGSIQASAKGMTKKQKFYRQGGKADEVFPKVRRRVRSMFFRMSRLSSVETSSGTGTSASNHFQTPGGGSSA